MANPTITNVDLGNVILKAGAFDFDHGKLFTAAGAATYLMGTILARKTVADAVAAAADAGNTGDGTVTAATVQPGPIVPIAGAYNLELLSADVAKGTATATAAADGGNTGDGTVTALTVAAGQVGLKAGAYNLECTSLGVKNGTAVGAAVATGTGNGTAGAVVAGSAAKAGAYIATCIDASVSGSETFKVIDPDGEELDQLTVGVAYSNNHIGITISDGSTDFIVGDFWTITITSTGGLFKLEDPNGSTLANGLVMDAGATQATVIETSGITFTITDGATDFVVGDKFAVTVANAAGTWKLEDPNGMILSNAVVSAAGALQATVINVAGLEFTITDGATDFIVGDKFALTVAANGKLVVFAVAGIGGAQIPVAVLTYEVVTTGAGDTAIDPLISGIVRKERLVIHGSAAGVGITDAILDQLRDYKISTQEVNELGVLDNQ